LSPKQKSPPQPLLAKKVHTGLIVFAKLGASGEPDQITIRIRVPDGVSIARASAMSQDAARQTGLPLSSLFQTGDAGIKGPCTGTTTWESGYNAEVRALTPAATKVAICRLIQRSVRRKTGHVHGSDLLVWV